jgi:putative ABC transport system substrate-binding protein
VCYPYAASAQGLGRGGSLLVALFYLNKGSLMFPMQRREFITLLGGAAAAWPLVARAQQAERMRRIGVLMYLAPDDAEAQARIATFTGALKQLGWSEGRNLSIDTRWATANDVHRHAAELVALAPDILLAGTGTATVAPLLQATHTVPIVFAVVIDPVGAGFVASLAHPGGNATGFTIFEYSMSGKWLELLKEIAPRVTRAAILRDPAVASGIGQFGAVQIVAPSMGVELSAIDVRVPEEIEGALAVFAGGLNGGLIVTSSALANVHRKLITTWAARHKLPTVYSSRHYVTDGGLISYGPDILDQYRRAADYVDRILKGEKPGPQGGRIRRRRERCVRVSLGWRSTRSIAGACSRPRSPACRRDCDRIAAPLHSPPSRRPRQSPLSSAWRKIR